MTLFDLSPEAKEQGLENIEIRSVTDETGKVEQGDVFVCIKGNTFDGHEHAAEMLEKGAAAVVCERDMGLKQQIIVPNSRKYFRDLASRYYGEPTKKLKLIAATGTNGKSTIVNVIKFALRTLGQKAGALGTINYDTGGEVYEAHLSTPRPMEMYRYFAEMVENGVEYCALEASSQALAQFRLYGEQFEIGIFTNLTQDHLDFHGTMENYYKAKKMLFKSCKKALICVDDKYGQRLAKEIDIPVITYSAKDHADYYCVNIKGKSNGVSYWLSSVKEEKSFPVTFKMPGLFNVANSMAAIAACTELGFSINACVEAVCKCGGICGRMEVIWDGDFTVICDYAHTPDALEKTLATVKSFAEQRIICLFAAAGERDEGKRPDMGKIVGRIADVAVLTSDNPRFEDPEKIIAQVEEGLKKQDASYKIFVDRMEAIEYALNIAKSGDIVLLAGKGHETYQVIGDEYLDFDEHNIVKEIMMRKTEDNA